MHLPVSLFLFISIPGQRSVYERVRPGELSTVEATQHRQIVSFVSRMPFLNTHSVGLLRADTRLFPVCEVSTEAVALCQEPPCIDSGGGGGGGQK